MGKHRLDADYYREEARKCREAAENALDQATKEYWQEAEKCWTALANQAELVVSLKPVRTEMPAVERGYMAELEFRVEVVGSDIVVTLPGYTYAVVYYKPAGSPALLMRHSVTKNDLRLRLTAAEFLEKAWKLANDQARELGWIV